MSYYYNYYLGYKKDDKIYPLGLFDPDGKFHSVLSKSRSFASDLHEDFLYVKEESFTEELMAVFSYEDFDGEIITYEAREVRYLPVSDLPTGSFIKSGYFLIDDVRVYEETKDVEGLFYDWYSPSTYMGLVQAEKLAGVRNAGVDVEGNEYEIHSAADYMYFCYPDYNSKEYEADFLRGVADAYWGYQYDHDVEFVILETEG